MRSHSHSSLRWRRPRLLGSRCATVGLRVFLVLGALACDKSEREHEPLPRAATSPRLTAAFASEVTARPAGSEAGPAAAGRVLRVLQMNLCNSGRAGCYRQGQAVDEAISVIRAQRPDVVTLNELCLADVTDRLFAAFSALFERGATYYAFQPTLDHVDGARTTCTSGSLYGIAVLGHTFDSSHSSVQTFGGVFEAQDAIVEDRVWSCVLASADHVACTTHLSADSSEVARTQCRELLTRTVPELRAGMSGIPAVIAGDLNLKRERADACVPAGFRRIDDGNVQHVLTNAPTPPFEHNVLPLEMTDHPALLIALDASVQAESP
jgi:hypothetical protein